MTGVEVDLLPARFLQLVIESRQIVAGDQIIEDVVHGTRVAAPRFVVGSCRDGRRRFQEKQPR